MNVLPLIALLNATPEAPAAPAPAATVTVAKTPRALLDSPKGEDVVNAAFADKSAPSAAEPGLSNVMPVAGALILLGAGAYFFTRRRKVLGGHVKVVESSSIGPKRTVTVVEVMGERLALAVTESGVTVLARALIPATEVAEAPLQVPMPPQKQWKADPNKAFADELLESFEDTDLRAKLAAGQASVVR